MVERSYKNMDTTINCSRTYIGPEIIQNQQIVQIVALDI